MVKLDPYTLATDSLVLAGFLHLALGTVSTYSMGLPVDVVFPLLIIAAGVYGHIKLPFNSYVLAVFSLASLSKAVYSFYQLIQAHPNISGINMMGIFIIIGLSAFTLEESVLRGE